MNPSEFQREEYRTLRKEIEETKARMFKLAGIALIGLPSITALAEGLEIQILLVVLPLFIVATMLLYLSESSGLMRCGTYIKYCIEAEISGEDKNSGWEHWLAEKTPVHEDRRRVDKMTFWFFITVFILYYLAASFLGARAAKMLHDTSGPTIAVAAYVAIFIIFVWSLRNHYNIAIQTS